MNSRVTAAVDDWKIVTGVVGLSETWRTAKYELTVVIFHLCVWRVCSSFDWRGDHHPLSCLEYNLSQRSR